MKYSKNLVLIHEMDSKIAQDFLSDLSLFSENKITPPAGGGTSGYQLEEWWRTHSGYAPQQLLMFSYGDTVKKMIQKIFRVFGIDFELPIIDRSFLIDIGDFVAYIYKKPESEELFGIADNIYVTFFEKDCGNVLYISEDYFWDGNYNRPTGRLFIDISWGTVMFLKNVISQIPSNTKWEKEELGLLTDFKE